MRVRRAATLALAAGCYEPPDVDPVRWEAPILSSEPDDPRHLCAPDREATVACAVDGDTVDLSACGDGERLRLLGIDAPETEKPGREADCWAEEAAVELGRLLRGRRVTVAFDRTCRDVYDRTLAYVWLPREDAETALRSSDLADLARVLRLDGDPTAPVLVNAWMLLGGFARRFDEDWVDPLRWDPELIAAERLARVRGNGLWGRCR